MDRGFCGQPMVYQVSLNTGVVDYDFPHLLRSLTAVGVFRPVNDPLLYVCARLRARGLAAAVSHSCKTSLRSVPSTSFYPPPAPMRVPVYSLLFR